MDRTVVALLPLVPKPIVGRFSARYIAGPSLEDAVREIRGLGEKGIMATVDILGENVTETSQAEQYAKEYIEVLETIRVNGLDANVSIKLTMLGLVIDEEFCYQRMREIVAAAAERKNFIRIDIEDSSVTDATFRIYEKLRTEFPNVGAAVQAYMRRTQDDVTRFIPMGANLRLCKGIYVEPKKIAWQVHGTINANFSLALRRLLEGGCYVGVATHDERLVWEAEKIVRDLGLDRSKYEFQMLLGVDEELRDIIVEAGHRMRVYVPFGKSWYAYSMRRLRENPKIVGYATRAVLGIR
ncbi:MAG: proline dehydrogenase family protein [Candidatus Eisenbacteria bacterium]